MKFLYAHNPSSDFSWRRKVIWHVRETMSEQEVSDVLKNPVLLQTYDVDRFIAGLPEQPPYYMLTQIGRLFQFHLEMATGDMAEIGALPSSVLGHLRRSSELFLLLSPGQQAEVDAFFEAEIELLGTLSGDLSSWTDLQIAQLVQLWPVIQIFAAENVSLREVQQTLEKNLRAYCLKLLEKPEAELNNSEKLFILALRSLFEDAVFWPQIEVETRQHFVGLANRVGNQLKPEDVHPLQAGLFGEFVPSVMTEEQTKYFEYADFSRILEARIETGEAIDEHLYYHLLSYGISPDFSQTKILDRITSFNFEDALRDETQNKLYDQALEKYFEAQNKVRDIEAQNDRIRDHALQGVNNIEASQFGAQPTVIDYFPFLNSDQAGDLDVNLQVANLNIGDPHPSGGTVSEAQKEAGKTAKNQALEALAGTLDEYSFLSFDEKVKFGEQILTLRTKLGQTLLLDQKPVSAAKHDTARTEIKKLLEKEYRLKQPEAYKSDREAVENLRKEAEERSNQLQFWRNREKYLDVRDRSPEVLKRKLYINLVKRFETQKPTTEDYSLLEAIIGTDRPGFEAVIKDMGNRNTVYFDALRDHSRQVSDLQEKVKNRVRNILGNVPQQALFYDWLQKKESENAEAVRKDIAAENISYEYVDPHYLELFLQDYFRTRLLTRINHRRPDYFLEGPELYRTLMVDSSQSFKDRKQRITSEPIMEPNKPDLDDKVQKIRAERNWNGLQEGLIQTAKSQNEKEAIRLEIDRGDFVALKKRFKDKKDAENNIRELEQIYLETDRMSYLHDKVYEGTGGTPSKSSLETLRDRIANDLARIQSMAETHKDFFANKLKGAGDKGRSSQLRHWAKNAQTDKLALDGAAQRIIAECTAMFGATSEFTKKIKQDAEDKMTRFGTILTDLKDQKFDPGTEWLQAVGTYFGAKGLVEMGDVSKVPHDLQDRQTMMQQIVDYTNEGVEYANREDLWSMDQVRFAEFLESERDQGRDIAEKFNIERRNFQSRVIQKIKAVEKRLREGGYKEEEAKAEQTLTSLRQVLLNVDSVSTRYSDLSQKYDDVWIRKLWEDLHSYDGGKRTEALGEIADFAAVFDFESVNQENLDLSDKESGAESLKSLDDVSITQWMAEALPFFERFKVDFDQEKENAKGWSLDFKFFTVLDIWRMGKGYIDRWMADWEETTKVSEAELTLMIFGQESDAGRQALDTLIEANKNKVDRWKKMYPDAGYDFFLSRMDQTTSKIEFRGCIEMMIESGRFYWDNPSFLLSLNRFQNTYKFTKADLEDFYTKKLTVMRKIELALGEIYPDDPYAGWKDEAESKRKSKMESLKDEAGELLDNSPETVIKRLSTMLEKWVSGDLDGTIRPADEFLSMIYYGYDLGRCNGYPDDFKLYYLMKALTTPDAKGRFLVSPTDVSQQFLNQLKGKYVPFEFFRGKYWKKDGMPVPEGTPGAKFGPFEASDFEIWGSFLNGIAGANNFEWNDAAKEASNRFYTEFMMADVAQVPNFRFSIRQYKDIDPGEWGHFFAHQPWSDVLSQILRRNSAENDNVFAPERAGPLGGMYATTEKRISSYENIYNAYLERGVDPKKAQQVVVNDAIMAITSTYGYFNALAGNIHQKGNGFSTLPADRWGASEMSDYNKIGDIVRAFGLEVTKEHPIKDYANGVNVKKYSADSAKSVGVSEVKDTAIKDEQNMPNPIFEGNISFLLNEVSKNPEKLHNILMSLSRNS